MHAKSADVGAAYRLGDVVKQSFYSCVGDCYGDDGTGSTGSTGGGGGGGGDSSSSGGSDGSSDGAGSDCRRLASDASEVPPCCVGWEVGMVWTVAMFATMLRLWLSDLGHRARFANTDRLHKLLDIAGYLLVLLAANSVKAYHRQEARQFEDDVDARFAGFCGFLSAAVGLWLLRYLEIAIFSHDQASRRYAASLFVDECGVLVCWLLAYYAGLRTSTPSSAGVDLGVALLLVLGAVWPELRAYWRAKRMALLPGTYKSRVLDPQPQP